MGARDSRRPHRTDKVDGITGCKANVSTDGSRVTISSLDGHMLSNSATSGVDANDETNYSFVAFEYVWALSRDAR